MSTDHKRWELKIIGVIRPEYHPSHAAAVRRAKALFPDARLNAKANRLHHGKTEVARIRPKPSASGPSNDTRPARTLRAPDRSTWERWDRAAQAAGHTSTNQWIVSTLDSTARSLLHDP